MSLFGNQLELKTLFSESILILNTMLRKVMLAEIQKQLVVTTIALKRHQLRHGKIPGDLQALCPEFLPSIPIDPVNGEPLHYKPNSGGTFLLYSVGEDGEDNGGDPNPAEGNAKSSSWQRGRDWVWPMPAMAVRSFSIRPPPSATAAAPRPE